MKQVIILTIGSLLIASCVEFKAAELPADKTLSKYTTVKKAESKLADGVIANGIINVGNWVSNKPSQMMAYGVKDTLIFSMNNVGPHWEELTLNTLPLDFSKNKLLIVECKIDGIRIPRMRIDLIDDQGRMSNSRPQELKLAPRSGYLRYVFNYEGAFYQNWPYKSKMDASRITKIRINVNGGGTAYSGKIYIKGMTAASER